jgi:type I restriction enzyme M protein
LRKALFKPRRENYLDLAVEKAAIKSAIYDHPEFSAFIAGMNAHFTSWRTASAEQLKTLQAGFHPKQVIAELAEKLLAHYANRPLIDAYDVYQHLLDYWDATMQDDAYLIAADGWKAETYRIVETKKSKDGKVKETDKGWTCDLVPKPLIVARFFAADQTRIDALYEKLDAREAELAELEEEHGGEDGLFSELEKINKANVSARLKEIKGDKTAKDEAAALNAWLKFEGEASSLKKQARDAEAALDLKALKQYPRLSEAEVKALVVDDKWLSALDAAIHGEMDRVSQALTQRVKQLAERYETPLPEMTARVAELEAKVEAHLQRMGFGFAAPIKRSA